MTHLEDALRTVDQWYLVREDFSLWVREQGEGKPVIVVHGGFGIDHSELVAPLEGLAGHRRVLWYDQRGSIRSPYSSPEQLETTSFEAHVGDLVALAEETGPADLIAHSMGTVLAMVAQRRRPELFRRILLVGAIRSDLNLLSPPGVTVVLGEQDFADFGGAGWLRAAAAHPGIDLRLVPDCGHLPWIDQPEAFQQILQELFPSATMTAHHAV